MPDPNTIEIRFVASDEGVVQSIEGVEQALSKSSRSFQDVERASGRGSASFHEVTRAGRLLTLSMTEGLEPGLRRIVFGLNEAAFVSRFATTEFGKFAAGGVAIVAAVIGLLVVRQNEAATSLAKMNEQMRRFDVGGLKSQLAGAREELEKFIIVTQGGLTSPAGFFAALGEAFSKSTGGETIPEKIERLQRAISTIKGNEASLELNKIRAAIGQLHETAAKTPPLMAALGHSLEESARLKLDQTRRAIAEQKEALKEIDRIARVIAGLQPGADIQDLLKKARLDKERLRLEMAERAKVAANAFLQESEPIFVKIAQQAKDAGFKLTDGLQQFIRQRLVPVQREEEQRQVALQMLGLSDPPAAALQTELLARLKKLQQIDFGVTLPKAGVGEGLLPTGNLINQLEQNRILLDHAFQKFIAAGFFAGGEAEQARRESIVQVAKTFQTLGLEWGDVAVASIERGLEGESQKAVPNLIASFQGFIERFVDETRQDQTIQENLKKLPLGERSIQETINQAIKNAEQLFGRLPQELKQRIGVAVRADEEFSRMLTKRLLGLPESPEKTIQDIAGGLEKQARQLGVTQFTPLDFLRQGAIDLKRQSEDFTDAVGSAFNVAFKQARRAILREAEALGLDILPEIAGGVARAERAGQRATLSIRIGEAVMNSEIAVAEAAARVGTTAGEQMAGGILHGLLVLKRDFGTLGTSLSELTQGIGHAMQRGMDDTFFNVITGQAKKLPDVFRQIGESIVREFTGQLAKLSIKSMFDKIFEAFPSLRSVGLGTTAVGGIAIPGLSVLGGSPAEAVLSSGAGGLLTLPSGAPGVGGSAGGGLSFLTGVPFGALATGAFSVLGLVTGGLGGFAQSSPIVAGITGSLLGIGLGLAINTIFQLTNFLIPGIGLVLGGLFGFFSSLFGGQDKKRIAAKQAGFNKWLQDLANVQTLDDLDFFLSNTHWEAVPGNERIARFLFGSHPSSTKDPRFSPEDDLQWNTGIFLKAVPDLVSRGSQAIRQKIAQLKQIESVPGGIVVEDVLAGDIRRLAIFGGGIGSLEERLAEARGRSSMAEIFLAQLNDEALAERLLKKLEDAAAKIDLRITRIKPFNVPGVFA